MNPVNVTVFAKNFPSEKSLEIYLLTPSEAASVFERAFGPGAQSYFKFPDDHWVVKSGRKDVGRWMEAYDADTIGPVASLLKHTVNWSPEDEIYFIARRQAVFKFLWRDFICCWDSFLACEDDAPMLMRHPSDGEVLMFAPLGNIYHIVR